MGQAKRRMEEAEDRGFWPSDDLICSRHLRSHYVVGHATRASVGGTCCVCGETSNDPVDFDSVLDMTVAVLRTYWHRAVDDLFHDSESDSGYAIASVRATSELVWEICESDFDEGFIELAADRITDDAWFRTGSLWLEGAELYTVSWREFSGQLRAKPDGDRTNLGDEPDHWAGEQADGIRRTEMLSRLTELIRELRLVVDVAQETTWRRAVHLKPEEPRTAERLGAAPPEHAGSNRWSPAGISMFYGSLDGPTALEETGLPDEGDEGVVGSWTSSRPFRVVDLSRLPALPDYFDVDRSWEREGLLFLRHFAEDVSRPVQHDDAEHRDYVPTQAVTAFLREAMPDLDGIIYRSSKTGQDCCVLFVDNDGCLREPSAVISGALRLVLTDVQ